MSVLVVDDHYANLLLTQSLLQREGHAVKLAQSGKDAIIAYREQHFDIILLDIQMPIMDGFETLKTIRGLKDPVQNPLVFALTAHTSPTFAAQILESGFDAILNKPFRIADLERHLHIRDGTIPPYAVPPAKSNVQARNEHNAILTLPYLDRQTVDILLSAIGPARMQVVVNAYWKDEHNLLKRISNVRFSYPSTLQAELDRLRKDAHGLKGAAANIGLLRLSRLAAKLQNAPYEMVGYLIETLNQTASDSRQHFISYCGLPQPRSKHATIG